MNKKFEAYCYKLIEKYSKILLLDKHIFELKYGTENKDSIMECVFNYPYLNVTIKYGDKMLKMFKEKKDIIPYLVHELCHPITDPLFCKANERYSSKDEILDERERLTDYICNIVIKNKY
jgi:hypothetical protein